MWTKFKDMEELIIDNAIAKVADRINEKRRKELFAQMDSSNPVFKQLFELRKTRQFVGGSKDKVYRKIASMPIEVDVFFSRIYGEDYYKEPDFFKKRAPEWAVIDRLDL